MTPSGSDIDDQPGQGARLHELGRLVRRRRERLPLDDGTTGLGFKAAAAIAGMSHVTWQRIERGEKVRALSYSGIERALGWPIGSIVDYLEGGDVPEASAAGDPSGASAPTSAVPSLLDATHDQLLAELRRRLYHLVPSEPVAGQRRHLAESGGEETAESVEARGGIPGLYLDDGEDEDEAQGGPA